jgi:hypothetical protein
MKRVHNISPIKKPVSQCTVAELAKKLIELEADKELNFSENEDGSDYWGAKKLSLFEQKIIIFGYYGGPAIQTYYPETDVLSDMIRHLQYHLDKKETDSVYLFEIERTKKPEELRENIVSSYFFYMWNAWCKEECKAVFGWEWEHFWNKWCGRHKKNPYGATEGFYDDLSINNRVKLVNHACEIYDGSKRKEEKN